MLPKSIRWKIQAFHGIILVVLVTALITGFYSYERRVRYRELDTQLLELITPLLPKVSPPRGGRFDGPPGRRPPGPEGDFPEPRARRELPAVSDDPALARLVSGPFYFVAWTPEGNRQSTNAPPDVAMPLLEETPEARVLIRTRGKARELIHWLPNGSPVLVGASTAEIDRRLHHLGLG